MTVFLLIRHAQKEGISGDAPLSSLGHKQAEATAALLAGTSVQAVYTSPLLRATQTARVIAEPHGLPVLADGRLRERANWGDLPGQSLEDFVAMWNRTTLDHTYIPPVGDSARQAGARLESFLQEIAQAVLAGVVIAVTHGGIITDFLATIFPVAILDRWHPDFLAAQSQVVAECSITEVRYEAARYALDRFADAAHLHASR